MCASVDGGRYTNMLLPLAPSYDREVHVPRVARIGGIIDLSQPYAKKLIAFVLKLLFSQKCDDMTT